MKQVLSGIVFFLGCALLPALVSGQAGYPAQVPAMTLQQRECTLALSQLEATYMVASQEKARAISAVQQTCAYDKDLLERALRKAAGTSSRGMDCTKPIDSRSFEYVPGETCEAKEAREAMAAARNGTDVQNVYQTPEARVYAAIARAIVQSKLLLPPGESAWDLLRSEDAARLTVGQRNALNKEFDSEAKRCFGAAMNETPERIGRAKDCLEAITKMSPKWEHLERERRRLAVAIDAVGVTVYGVDAVLAGRTPPPGSAMPPTQTAVSTPTSPRQELGAVGGAIAGFAQMIGIPPTPPKPPKPSQTANVGYQPLPQPATRPVATANSPSAGAPTVVQATPAPPVVQQNNPAPLVVSAPQLAYPPTQNRSPSDWADVSPAQPQPQAQVASVPVQAAAERVNPFALSETSPTRNAAVFVPSEARPAPAPSPLLAAQETLRAPLPVAPAPTATPRLRKVALVIGNSKYIDPQWPLLKNTVNDVRLVGGALTSIGFEVTQRTDLTRDDLIEALAEFSRKAKGADIATIYYAGHAVEINGKNILLPIDAKGRELIALEGRGYDAEQMRNSLSGAAFRMLVLDSCRDNPYSSRVSGQYASTRGTGGGGLAKMNAEDGQGNKGSLILFSTAPGESALDYVENETEMNSPFATVFAQSIVSPGVPIQTILVRITNGVERLTNSEQQPYRSDSILDEHIYLTN